MENIRYATPEIERFYREHRTRWNDFYESERVVFERLDFGPATTVLDIGCGCGGLGLALRERFGVTRYTGIEINEPAAVSARALNSDARILAGDFMQLGFEELGAQSFDVVVSLSCIDWNLRFADMLRRAYALTEPGGYLVSSFRLTTGASIDDMSRSYQHISFDGSKSGEKAPYVVLNARGLFNELLSLGPRRVTGYGYWGTPSVTATTPYDRICFAVIALQRERDGSDPPRVDLDLPDNILRHMGHSR
jgi:SAM-dependent methyltransferase